MKTNQTILKIIALICTFTQLLSVFTVIVFSESIQNGAQNSAASSNTLSATLSTEPKQISKKELKPLLGTGHYTVTEPIQIKFDKTGISNYHVVSDGIMVNEQNSNSMEFELTATDIFGNVDVYVEYNDGTTAKSSLYTYKSGDAVYVSDISKDRAWYNCMEEQYNQGLITKVEWDEQYSELSRTFIEETPSISETPAVLSASSSVTSITGVFAWELQDGSLLPLRQTKVELRDDETIGSVSISTTYTDNNGRFSFTFDDPDEWYNLENNGLDIFIRIYTEAKTFEVNQDLAFTYNYFDTPAKSNVSFGASSVFNYHIAYDESNNVNKAVSVLQGMVVGERFATSMGMSTNNFIHVVYPSGVCFDNDSAFCWGDVIDNCYSVIGKDKFYDFDTLIHEYGHFVECSMGTYGASLLEIFINEPEHASHTDHFDDKKEKEYAMELTWSEAWATVFSFVAQLYYANDYPNIPTFADIAYGTITNSNPIDYYETYTCTGNSCEAQEDAVIAFLWDLYDDGTELQDNATGTSTTSTESFDNISLGNSLWWNCTTQSGTYTLTDFINLMNSDYPSMRSNIGALLENHQIAPGDLMITNIGTVSATIPPVLSWKVNGSQKHPNTQFEVVFYDAYDNYLYSSPLIENTQDYNTTFTYTVSNDTWAQVIKDYCGVFSIRIAVRGYRTDSPSSGPYESKHAVITVVSNKSFSITAHTKHTEQVIKLDKEKSSLTKVTFETSGVKLFQTFGTMDTKMTLHSSDGTLLTSDDDSGYGANSFIRYDCEANTEYQIRIQFYNTNSYGTTKLSITPAPWLLNSGSTALDTYEDIYTVSNRTSFNLSTTAAPNRTKVLTFRAPSDGYYTFELRSDFDTYIYVIDPRSNKELTFNVDYNDDCDDCENSLDAKLTVELDQNIPYLVIYSAFNPGTLTESLPMNVIIKKVS